MHVTSDKKLQWTFSFFVETGNGHGSFADDYWHIFLNGSVHPRLQLILLNGKRLSNIWKANAFVYKYKINVLCFNTVFHLKSEYKKSWTVSNRVFFSPLLPCIMVSGGVHPFQLVEGCRNSTRRAMLFESIFWKMVKHLLIDLKCCSHRDHPCSTEWNCMDKIEMCRGPCTAWFLFRWR